jgi:hypothetical protein
MGRMSQDGRRSHSMNINWGFCDRGISQKCARPILPSSDLSSLAHYEEILPYFSSRTSDWSLDVTCPGQHVTVSTTTGLRSLATRMSSLSPKWEVSSYPRTSYDRHFLTHIHPTGSATRKIPKKKRKSHFRVERHNAIIISTAPCSTGIEPLDR